LGDSPNSYENHSELVLLREKLKLLEFEKQLRDGLGYKYAHKFYTWQTEFIDSTNKMRLLNAANQLGKSTCQIIDQCEHDMFSTDEERLARWPGFKPGSDTITDFYLYPDSKTATIEFETKWKKYLPKGIYLEDPELKKRYWWKPYYSNGEIDCVEFREGLLAFKTYGQGAINIQGTSAHSIKCDEELPYELYSELISRTNATCGYFSMVFTATIGGIEWYRAMEKIGESDELFPNAYKRQISLYDSMYYSDGTPSGWTKERIAAVKSQYGTEEEIEKRVMGRFVVEKHGLLLPNFLNKHIVNTFDYPSDWHYYCGIDIGRGGKNHKSAITIVAVRPDYKKAVVCDAWREDTEITTEHVVLGKYKEMIKQLPNKPITFYDFHAKDFELLMMSDSTVNMYPAEKKHEIGFGILNSLMKNDMMYFYLKNHVYKLVDEIRTCKITSPKTSRKDDLCDSLRYSISSLVFDFTGTDAEIKVDPPKVDELERSLENYKRMAKEEVNSQLDEEIAELNMMYSGGVGYDDDED
jgi:phage terminase large subunit-like protein